MIRGLSKALKQMCPLYAIINTLCFWEVSVTDDGLKGLLDFATKNKPVSPRPLPRTLLPLSLTVVSVGPSLCQWSARSSGNGPSLFSGAAGRAVW